jgi:hypothetical protein
VFHSDFRPSKYSVQRMKACVCGYVRLSAAYLIAAGKLIIRNCRCF